MAQHMQALTLASARHLLNQGHITPQHHARIAASVGAVKKPKKPPAVRGFGSLAQQAQAPIPGIGSDPTTAPAGTSSGF